MSDTMPLKPSMTKTQVFLRLTGYLKAYWWALPLVVLGFAISAGTEVFIAKLLQFITDAINEGDREKITWFPALVIVLFVLRGVGSFFGGYYSAYVARHLVYTLRTELFDKLLRMPTAFYLKTPSGAIASKLIFDVEQLSYASTEAITTLLKDGLTVIALLSYLLYTNWRLTLVLFIVLPPVLWLIGRVAKKFALLSADIQDSMASVSHITNEAINGYHVVKNYGGQAYEATRFNEASLKSLNQGLKMTIISTINTPLIQLLMAIGMCFVIWISLRPEVLGRTSAGEFISYLTAIGLLSKPVRSLTDVNNHLQRGIAAALSVFRIIDSQEERDTGNQTPTLTGNIQINNVSLTYESGVQAICQLDLTVSAGQTVAVVGRSGSGKTSLVNLLTRTIAPTSGQILFDGVDIEEISLSVLRRQIALVNQQVVLFNDTVAGNIAYGTLANKSQEQIITASQAAYADEFIQKLPNGYDSHIGADGLQLSGGQRQRLSIARALLKEAPILILDEATSALDNESEFFIQKALDAIMQERTTIVIAHRLSTIKKADVIIVMDQGQIVERGTHEALIAQNGLYRTMYEQNFSKKTDNQ